VKKPSCKAKDRGKANWHVPSSSNFISSLDLNRKIEPSVPSVEVGDKDGSLPKKTHKERSKNFWNGFNLPINKRKVHSIND